MSLEHTPSLFPWYRRGSASDCFDPADRADGKALLRSNVIVPDSFANVVEDTGGSISPLLAGSIEAGSVIGIPSSFTACSHLPKLPIHSDGFRGFSIGTSAPSTYLGGKCIPLCSMGSRSPVVLFAMCVCHLIAFCFIATGLLELVMLSTHTPIFL